MLVNFRVKYSLGYLRILKAQDFILWCLEPKDHEWDHSQHYHLFPFSLHSESSPYRKHWKAVMQWTWSQKNDIQVSVLSLTSAAD